VDRAPPPLPEPAVTISPMRMQQAVPTPQLIHPGINQLHQQGAAAIQPQLMRLQPTNQATGMCSTYYIIIIILTEYLVPHL